VNPIVATSACVFICKTSLKDKWHDFFVIQISYRYQSTDLEMDDWRMWRHEWFGLVIALKICIISRSAKRAIKGVFIPLYVSLKDDQLRKAWIHYCRRWNFNPTSGHKLCSCQWLLWKGSLFGVASGFSCRLKVPSTPSSIILKGSLSKQSLTGAQFVTWCWIEIPSSTAEPLVTSHAPVIHF
jgi:hypothetical protein